jgi:hypothetical protein
VIKRLKITVGFPVHIYNLDHLAKQQTVSTHHSTESETDPSPELEPERSNHDGPPLQVKQVHVKIHHSKDQAYITKTLDTLEKKYRCPVNKPEPDPIHVPEPYPVVDWQALACPNWKDRIDLPSPAYLPIHACRPLHPHQAGWLRLHGPPQNSEDLFGKTNGYMTTMGPVRMPSTLING